MREADGLAMPDGAFAGGTESLAERHGALLRRCIAPSQPMIRTNAPHPRDRDFLASVLRPG